MQFKNVKKNKNCLKITIHFFLPKILWKSVVLDPTDKTFWKIINVPQIKKINTAWKWVVVHSENVFKQLALDFQEITK